MHTVGKDKTPIVSRALSQLCVCRAVLISVSKPWAGSELKLSYIGDRPDLSHVLLLPSERWSRYQIILLGDRGTCVWTTCLRSVTRQCPGAESNLHPWVTSGLQVRHVTVRLPHSYRTLVKQTITTTTKLSKNLTCKFTMINKNSKVKFSIKVTPLKHITKYINDNHMAIDNHFLQRMWFVKKHI